jgi:hypothetical protein
LLLDEVGRGPSRSRLSFHFWPPRRLRPEAIPPVAAVWISHEHEDHFNVPTLSRIDRRVPILLSSRTSTAARRLTAELGFVVRLIEPGETVAIGDLELTAYSPEQRALHDCDEWDTLAYLVSDARRNGAFFTNVDVPVSSAMATAVNRRVEEPTACETISFEGMTLGLWQHSGSHPTHRREMHVATKPANKEGIPVGGGQDVLATLRFGSRFQLLPGQTARFAAGKLIAVDRECEFLAAAEKPWPAIADFWPTVGSEIEAPVCGNAELPTESASELEAGLEALATFLYGSSLFKRLYSISSHELGKARPTFALLLLAGEGEAYAYEYRPQDCAFQALDDADDLAERYVGTVTMWATDLLALFRAEIEPRTIVKSTHEHWSAPCADASFTIDILWPFFHPLRHPDRTLEQYRRIAAEHSGAAVWVRHSLRGEVGDETMGGDGGARGGGAIGERGVDVAE